MLLWVCEGVWQDVWPCTLALSATLLVISSLLDLHLTGTDPFESSL